jgi:ABC-2 type transport system permease protein
MTTTRHLSPARPPATGQRVTQARVVRSEWTKLRSVPSTAWSLLAAVALIVGFGALYCVLRVTRPPTGPEAVAAFDSTAVSLTGVQLAQLAIGVLGVLLVAGEYATGTIRVSLAAVPRRLPVLWGKAIVVALTAPLLFVLRDLCNVSGQPVGSVQRAARHLAAPAGRGQGGARQRPVPDRRGAARVGPGRPAAQHRRGAIASLFGVLFGLQIVVGFLPASVADKVSRYLPTPAGVAVTNVRPDPASLPPWTGFGLFCLYTVILLGLAAWLSRRHDV